MTQKTKQILNTKVDLYTIKSGIYGLCIGDALGVPGECRNREELRREPITEMVDSFHHLRNQPKGSWSDDSSMTLCLMDSLALTGGLHTHDLMARFRDWKDNGAYTPLGYAFDWGNNVAWALSRSKHGTTPVLCGGNKPNTNGNGSLMRILPMAYYLYPRYGGNLATNKPLSLVHKASAVTHRHAYSLSACDIYVNIASRMLDGMELRDAVDQGVSASLHWHDSHRISNQMSVWDRLRNMDTFQHLPEDEIDSHGYVVSTLEAALWCLLNTDNYRDCVVKAVNLGHDTDSTAAVAGGLAGLYYGYDAIPAEWVADLLNKELINDICLRFAEEIN